MNQETIFIDHADTDVGLEKLRRLKARRFNCLIFNISDDNLHNEKGDLREMTIRFDTRSNAMSCPR